MRTEYFNLWKLNHIQSQQSNAKPVVKGIQIDIESTSRFKQIALFIIGMIFVLFGAMSMVFVVSYLDTVEMQCASVTESIFISVNDNGTSLVRPTGSEKETLLRNPELFVWNQCLYKVRRVPWNFVRRVPSVMVNVMQHVIRFALPTAIGL